MRKANIAVLVSGGGTNLQAILDAEAAGILSFGSVKLVVSNKAGVYALERARKAGVPAAVLRGDTREDVLAHAEAIKSSMPVYPQVQEQGPAPGAPMGKAQILQIKDARARKAAILATVEPMVASLLCPGTPGRNPIGN